MVQPEQFCDWNESDPLPSFGASEQRRISQGEPTDEQKEEWRMTMKKIALATAAVLFAAGGAFAQTASNPNSADRPSTWQDQPASGIDYGSTASIATTDAQAVPPATPRSGDAAPYVNQR